MYVRSHSARAATRSKDEPGDCRPRSRNRNRNKTVHPSRISGIQRVKDNMIIKNITNISTSNIRRRQKRRDQEFLQNNPPANFKQITKYQDVSMKDYTNKNKKFQRSRSTSPSRSPRKKAFILSPRKTLNLLPYQRKKKYEEKSNEKTLTDKVQQGLPPAKEKYSDKHYTALSQYDIQKGEIQKIGVGLDVDNVITPNTANENEIKIVQNAIQIQVEKDVENKYKAKQKNMTKARAALNEKNENIQNKNIKNTKTTNITSKKKKTNKESIKKKKKEMIDKFSKSEFYKTKNDEMKQIAEHKETKSCLQSLVVGNLSNLYIALFRLKLFPAFNLLVKPANDKNKIKKIARPILRSAIGRLLSIQYNELSGQILSPAFKIYHKMINEKVSWDLVKSKQYWWMKYQPTAILIKITMNSLGTTDENIAKEKIQNMTNKSKENGKLFIKMTTETYEIEEKEHENILEPFIEVYKANEDNKKKFKFKRIYCETEKKFIDNISYESEEFEENDKKKKTIKNGN
eukprot:368237_1